MGTYVLRTNETVIFTRANIENHDKVAMECQR